MILDLFVYIFSIIYYSECNSIHSWALEFNIKVYHLITLTQKSQLHRQQLQHSSHTMQRQRIRMVIKFI